MSYIVGYVRILLYLTARVLQKIKFPWELFFCSHGKTSSLGTKLKIQSSLRTNDQNSNFPWEQFCFSWELFKFPWNCFLGLYPSLQGRTELNFFFFILELKSTNDFQNFFSILYNKKSDLPVLERQICPGRRYLLAMTCFMKITVDNEI